jgi:hypothetical protein
MIVYRIWDGSDMANSDCFYPTFEAVARIARVDYGIKGSIKLEADGSWEGTAGADCGSASGMDVHISRYDITCTREGLCWALNSLPHR